MPNRPVSLPTLRLDGRRNKNCGKWLKPLMQYCIPFIAHGLNRGLLEYEKQPKPFQWFIKHKIMPHSFNKIWIHAIWATKERLPLINASVEDKIHPFISVQLREQGCLVKIINGMPDHIHCLFLLNPQKSIAEVIKQIKGSSSHFVNQNNLILEKFAWQTGYAAYSVSESVVDKVFLYIKNQKQHHTMKTFQQEYDEFLKLYGLGNDK
jgi:REP element-mobilizing transposase RayT